jgi:hypothetical protein
VVWLLGCQWEKSTKRRPPISIVQLLEEAMLAGLDASGARIERRIVPFVSGGRESESVTVCFSQEDQIHRRIEVMIELLLVAVGVAGIVGAMV